MVLLKLNSVMSNDNWSSCEYHFMPATLMLLLLLDNDSKGEPPANVKPLKRKATSP